MSYCLNPTCTNPKNPDNAIVCQTCGSKLRLRDRYLGGKLLGQGGFGATFLAIDLSLPGKPPCVIKQLRPSSNDPSIFQMAKELFEREAETLGRIGNHPQVPRLLDYFEHNKDFYLVQEYVSGNNLQQEIKKNGPLSEAGARQFLSEILPMIQYIHSQNVIHRDIKPANLIRREQDKKLVLIDFGAVKNQVNPQAAANTSDQTALTSFAIGTPGFAPPEQMALRPVYASDIYALGVTCIYLLTGKSPKELDYNPKTGEMMWRKDLDISDSFAKVLTKMLEVSVRHRYQSSEEVLRALDLEAYEDSLRGNLIVPPKAPPPPPVEQSSGRQNSSPAASATQKLAERIRQQKLKQNQALSGGAYSSFSGNTTGTRGRLYDSGQGANTIGSAAKKKNVRLDEETVLNSYVKGRRDFGQQNLSSLNLPEANLAESNFHQSKLRKTNLEKANLSGCNFGRASLTQAICKNANLGRAYCHGADLSGADFRGADLSHANLSNANLLGANFCGANLSSAKVTEEQLAQAKTNWQTIMPNGRRGFWS